MRRPRVAFVTNLCPEYRRPLYELLAEQFQVSFFFFSEGEERYLGSGVRHVQGDLPVRSVRRVAIAGHPLLVGLAHELRSDRYDAVIKCLNGRLMVPYVYGLTRARRLPFVLWSGMWHHPKTLGHRVTRPVVEQMYRGADAIVTYGDHVKRFVVDAPGVDPRKVYVAGQAIDPAPFSTVEPRFEQQPAEILFIGQLEQHKGIHELLNAFAAVKSPGARLRFAGSGNLIEEVRRRARLDSRIDVLNHVPHAELPRELSRARCVVLPSVTTVWHRECWGLVVNEAMAAGVPVIATDAVGAVAGGLVRDGRNGLVVPEGRPEALAEAIDRLVSDVALARGLGIQARTDVRAFDYPRMAQAFVEATEHAIAARSGRGIGHGRAGSDAPRPNSD